MVHFSALGPRPAPPKFFLPLSHPPCLLELFLPSSPVFPCSRHPQLDIQTARGRCCSLSAPLTCWHQQECWCGSDTSSPSRHCWTPDCPGWKLNTHVAAHRTRCHGYCSLFDVVPLSHHQMAVLGSSWVLGLPHSWDQGNQRMECRAEVSWRKLC